MEQCRVHRPRRNSLEAPQSGGCLGDDVSANELMQHNFRAWGWALVAAR